VRWALAIGVIAVTLAAAVFVHQRHTTTTTAANGTCTTSQGIAIPGTATNCSGTWQPYTYETHPSWEDPVAVLLAIGGVAVAVGIVLAGRQPT
jgi:hypothetical protein